MKKKAFLQALIIVILLTASWILFMNRKIEPEPVQAPQPVAATPSEPETVKPDPVPETETPPAEPQGVRIRNRDSTPPLWQEWIEYLERQETPAALQAALAAMHDSVFSMEKEDASARLIELIISGVDIETGMPFKVGPDGILSGSPTMHVMLLDWLGQIDSKRAVAIAELALNSGGTNLGPDRFVMHLRNYALGTPLEDEEGKAYIRGNFDILVRHEPWIGNPTASIAESMDVAVYLGDPSLVPEMAILMGEDSPPALQHAASLAMERLIDRNPAEAISQLLGSPDGQAMTPAARAGFVARLDPVDATGKDLLQNYLSSEDISRDEAALFLAHFPNLNQSLSHNLISNNNSITASPGHMERLQRALDEIRGWKGDPGISGLDEALAESEARLQMQLSGSPSP